MTREVKTSVLFVVSSDPRNSPRPAEAVRIAAGIGAWGKVEVTVYLRDAAVLALGEFPDDLIDGENFERYLPIVAESGGAVFVQRDAPLLKELGDVRLRFQPLDDVQLAELASGSRSVIRF